MVSSGSADANVEKFAGVFADDIVLQEKREVADAVRARWTPTSIFVRTDGTIGSYLAAGDEAIRELIDKIRKENLAESQLYFANETNNGGPAPKIGESLPDFSLDDIKGNRITSDDLRGKRTLAVFWSLTCPHCNAMMNDLKAWNDARDDKDPQLVVFSDGSKEDHADIGLNAPVVLDSGYKTSAKLGMFGTPSAVLLDSSGRIVTETGVGASNIWALIGRRP
jgi:peroxiredoxin